MSRNKVGLKKAGQLTEYTPEQLRELIKCKNDPIYFIENYVYIRHPKRGKIKFTLYDYQKEMVNRYKDNRFCITLSARQTGKCLLYNTPVYIVSQPPNAVKRFLKKLLTIFSKPV